MSRRSPKREQLALAELHAETDSRAPRDVFVTRAHSSAKGVSLHIVSAPQGKLVETTSPVSEAALVVDALLELPVSTRRELFLMITQDHSESFNGVPRAKTTKSHPWPPKPRRPE